MHRYILLCRTRTGEVTNIYNTRYTLSARPEYDHDLCRRSVRFVNVGVGGARRGRQLTLRSPQQVLGLGAGDAVREQDVLGGGVRVART
jgi:hypothetical protein